MGRLKTVLRELVGLFVDDGNFAVAIAVWLAVSLVLLAHFASARWWGGPLVVAGLALVLVESVTRAARRR